MAALNIIGGFIKAAGEMQQGEAEDAAAQSEALQMESRGKEEFAASQRDALAKRREGTIANSRIQALAAASGGGADGATIIKLMSGVTQESEFNAASSLYGGRERKAGLFDAAKNRRAGGKASLLGSQYAAFGSVIGGFSDAASSMASAGSFG
jgi:hypothetical protein